MLTEPHSTVRLPIPDSGNNFHLQRYCPTLLIPTAGIRQPSLPSGTNNMRPRQDIREAEATCATDLDWNGQRRSQPSSPHVRHCAETTGDDGAGTAKGVSRRVRNVSFLQAINCSTTGSTQLPPLSKAEFRERIVMTDPQAASLVVCKSMSRTDSDAARLRRKPCASVPFTPCWKRSGELSS